MEGSYFENNPYENNEKYEQNPYESANQAYRQAAEGRLKKKHPY